MPPSPSQDDFPTQDIQFKPAKVKTIIEFSQNAILIRTQNWLIKQIIKALPIEDEKSEVF